MRGGGSEAFFSLGGIRLADAAGAVATGAGATTSAAWERPGAAAGTRVAGRTDDGRRNSYPVVFLSVRFTRVFQFMGGTVRQRGDGPADTR